MDALVGASGLGNLLAVCCVLLCSTLLAGFGSLVARRWCGSLDPLLQFGIYGLVGLGMAGSAVAVSYALPFDSALRVAVVAVVGIIAALGSLRSLVAWKAAPTKLRRPERAELLAVVALGLCAAFCLVALTAPSTAADWDSIAYHMAVPRLYVEQGSLARIPYIHHSNFPSVVEMLFIPSAWLQTQSAAKAFLLAYSGFGALAIFGLTRERYGRPAGWWAAVAFATVPTVIWESGTAYIDVAHGLFAGLGVLLALRAATKSENLWVPAGLLLGFACASKYTGLQVVALTALVLAILTVCKISTQGWKPILAICGLAVLVGGPWYVRNLVATGNPVYPFLYEQFGGKDWDQRRAGIYRDEQLSFGVGVSAEHKDWSQLGHAVLGLAYQPGRYVNPLQTQGGGSPLGAIGIAVLGGMLFWAVAKRPDAFEASVLAFAGLSFVLWFALSQQSRYIVTLAIPASVLVGGAVVQGGLGKIVAGLTLLQGAYTLWLYDDQVVASALPVATDQLSPNAYLHKHLNFAEAADDINRLPTHAKIALYDEVFGYYLNRSYFWANPPHCTVIPYDSMRSASDYVYDMRNRNFTNIYIQFVSPDTDGAFAQALGYAGTPISLPLELRDQWSADWIQKWKVLVADAALSGEIKVVKTYRFGMLLELEPATRPQR